MSIFAPGPVSERYRRQYGGHEGDIEHCEQYHYDGTGDPEDRTDQERYERNLYAEPDKVRDEQDDEAHDSVDDEGS